MRSPCSKYIIRIIGPQCISRMASNPNMEEEVTAATSVSSSSGKISVEDLSFIITDPAGGFFMLPSDAYNEVFDGILIGEA